MSFNKDIEAFKNKAEKAASAIVRGSFLAIVGKIIVRTPVDTGRLRGNWITTVNNPSTRQLSDKDKSGRKAVGFAKETSKAFKLGESLFMVNNLPYVGPIENGSSQQAPSGMVKVSILGLQGVVSALARKNR